MVTMFSMDYKPYPSCNNYIAIIHCIESFTIPASAHLDNRCMVLCNGMNQDRNGSITFLQGVFGLYTMQVKFSQEGTRPIANVSFEVKHVDQHKVHSQKEVVTCNDNPFTVLPSTHVDPMTIICGGVERKSDGSTTFLLGDFFEVDFSQQ